MPPVDPDRLLLLREWIEKADADLQVAEKLAGDVGMSFRIREIAGFHCQQAAEKYLKAILTFHQIEFPKTHDIQVLLQLVHQADPAGANAMREADWLTPFGVKARYPGDAPEMLPEDEERALDLARLVKRIASMSFTW